LTWVIWDKIVDETFRPDFKILVEDDIPPNPVQTLDKHLIHWCGKITKDQIEAIGNLYQNYVIFKAEL